MLALRLIALLVCVAGVLSACDGDGDRERDSTPPRVWLTDPGHGIHFAEQPFGVNEGADSTATVIRVDAGQEYQEIDGFGFALMGGSALHLHNMSASARTALLRELFGTAGSAIGTSYLRVSIGASDLDAEVFSYNDLPPGDTDPGMTRFSLDRDREHLIPVLKEILAINPALKIMGAPWSPPVWMKTVRSSIGGRLRPEHYPAYANYFVKYLEGMAAEGIVIDAITPQNEPLHPGNNPSLFMPATEQAAFIKTALGPALRAARLNTKIVIYDHNADRPEYPLAILDDPAAKVYVDGSAFHLYAGAITALSTVHAQHPDRNLYFTEQWVGAPGNLAEDLKWHTRELIVGATRNWARTVLEWNLAADADQRPHTPGGCTQCLGAVTIVGDSVTRNSAYYIIAHAAKFVRPGSVRIASNEVPGLPNVAFRTPTGELVLIVLNDDSAAATFRMEVGQQPYGATLQAGAVGTYLLPAS